MPDEWADVSRQLSAPSTTAANGADRGRGGKHRRAVTGWPARFTLDGWDLPRWDAPSGGPD
jgi:hypothetical protein